MRRHLASGLCYTSQLLTTVMAVLSGLGVTVAIIVLAINGTISVVAAIVIFFVSEDSCAHHRRSFRVSCAAGRSLTRRATQARRASHARWSQTEPHWNLGGP